MSNNFDENEIEKISKLYSYCKQYSARAEELLDGMNTFVAPLFEYRDAFDHLMILVTSKEPTKKQYDSIKGHLERAFFDIVDFICIKVREEIAEVLKLYKRKKILDAWETYEKNKIEVYDASVELANIRAQRGWNLTDNPEKYAEMDIEKYKEIADKFLKIQENFIKEVEPKLVSKRS